MRLDEVVAAQADLVKPIHTLKQVLCCKGKSDNNRHGKRAVTVAE